MTADETINRWAAKRLEIEPADVLGVSFESHKGFWYSEVTYEPSYSGAHVTTAHGVRTIPLDIDGGEEFSALLREIIEAADA